MKNLKLLSLSLLTMLFCFCISSCSKDDDNDTESITTLAGYWISQVDGTYDLEFFSDGTGVCPRELSLDDPLEGHFTWTYDAKSKTIKVTWLESGSEGYQQTWTNVELTETTLRFVDGNETEYFKKRL